MPRPRQVSSSKSPYFSAVSEKVEPAFIIMSFFVSSVILEKVSTQEIVKKIS